MIAVNAALDKALFSLLRDGTATRENQRALSDAFTAAIHCAAGGEGKASDVLSAANALLASPRTTPLEQLFVRVSTALHCHVILRSACNPSGCADGNTLPVEVEAAAMALAAALCVCERHVWYGFLCIFLQQLSARGKNFDPWRQFFRKCAAQAEQAIKCTSPGEIDGELRTEGEKANAGEEDEKVKCATLWAAVSDELFASTVERTRFRRALHLYRSFVPYGVEQAPGTTYRLLHVLHAFIDEWNEMQNAHASPVDGDHAKKRKGKECNEYWDGEEKEKQRAREEEMIRRHGEAFCHVISEGQVHAYLTATVLVAALSSRYILSRRTISDAQSIWSDPRRAVLNETNWKVVRYPPLGRLLDVTGVRSLVSVHLFVAGTQFRMGPSHMYHVEGRQKLALCLYVTGLCSLRVAFAIYHFSASTTLATDEDAMPATDLAAFTAAVQRYVDAARSELVFAPVPAAVSTGDNAALAVARKRSRHGRDGTGEAEKESLDKEKNDSMPVSGEAIGPRFSRMVFPVACPSWKSICAEESGKGEAQSSSVKGSFVAPCRFVLDLLSMGLPALAARTITQFRTEYAVDVCLVPSAALGSSNGTNIGNNGSGSAAIGAFTSKSVRNINTGTNNSMGGMSRSNLGVAAWTMRHVEGIFEGDAAHILRSLEAFSPLLATIPTYVASQRFLCVLLEGIDEACEQFLQTMRKPHVEADGSGTKEEEENNKDKQEEKEGDGKKVEMQNKKNNLAAKRCRWAMGIVELYLIRVVMPCMRVLPPSPILYDRVHVLLSLICREGSALHFGVTPAEFLHTRVWMESLLRPDVPRAPHDLLRSKELDTLFTQSLKRMTQANVNRYREILRPVIYANPLLVAEKLFQQAVGYGNNFLRIHTQLLMGAPAAVMTLVIHAGLDLMRKYAEKERIGTNDANRVGLIGTFLAVLWRDNPRIFDGTLLLRAAEYALRREARASIVFGLELLKSLLHEMLDVTLEHEEQYSVSQVRALLAPPLTEWLAKGAAESFRRGRWDEVLTPAVLAEAGGTLRVALIESCAVPLESFAEETVSDEGEAQEEEEEEEEELVVMTLGQWILLHLCRLHSKVYAIQADLPGTMEIVLLTCARDYNVINDLLLCLEGQIMEGPPLEQLLRVAMPHIALRLTARFASKKIQQEQQQQQHQQQHQPDIRGGRDEENEKRGGSIGLGGQKAFHQKETKTPGPSSVVSSLPAVDSFFTVPPNIYHEDEDANEVEDEEAKNGKDTEERVGERDIQNKIPSSSTDFKKSHPWRNFKPVDGVIPFSLLRRLSRYTAAHFVFDESVYVAAEKEVACFLNHAQSLLKQQHSGSAMDISTPTSHDATIRWVEAQRHRVRLEKGAHRRLYEQCAAAHKELLNSIRSGGVFRSPSAFAVSYLLPRALLSLEDTLFVAHFLRWLLDATRPVATEHEAAVCALLSLVTAAMTFFVGLTDGECKRVGLLLSLVLTDMRGVAEMPPPPAVLPLPLHSQRAGYAAQGGSGGSAAVPLTRGGTDTSGAASSCMETLRALLDPKPRSLMELLSPRDVHGHSTRGSDNNHTNVNGGSGEKDREASALLYTPPAYPLQLEAYLCRALVQLLVHQKDIAFLHRNAFLVLERLVKRDPPFPSTLTATAWLIRAVAPHAVRSSSCYASATAVLKVLQDSQRRKRRMLQEATPSPLMIASHRAAGRPGKEVWRNHWATREAYMRSLLNTDMEAAASQQKDRCEGNDNEEEEEVEEEEEEEGNDTVVAAEKEEEEEEEEGEALGVNEETVVVDELCDEVPELLDEDRTASFASSVNEDLSPENDEHENYERNEEESRHGDTSIAAGSEAGSAGSVHCISGRKRSREESRNGSIECEPEAHIDESNEDPALPIVNLEANSEKLVKGEM